VLWMSCNGTLHRIRAIVVITVCVCVRARMCLQVLLELSDVELEVGLGITHPMHRKKLRLAIEEHRHPALVRYPCIAQLGHTWVSSEWLPDLGLAQASAMLHGCYRANIYLGVSFSTVSQMPCVQDWSYPFFHL